jgi:hypothetical protein
MTNGKSCCDWKTCVETAFLKKLNQSGHYKHSRTREGGACFEGRVVSRI